MEENESMKRRKTTPVMVEEQGEQAQEKAAEELVDTRFTFRIVTVDGGKTLDIELPIPRYVGMLIFL